MIPILFERIVPSGIVFRLFYIGKKARKKPAWCRSVEGYIEFQIGGKLMLPFAPAPAQPNQRRMNAEKSEPGLLKLPLSNPAALKPYHLNFRYFV